MVNAQEYINEKYLNKEERTKITYLDISNKNLEGELDLKDFKNLKSLHCHSNRLTGLNLNKDSNLEDLGCHFNQLTNIDFLKTLNTKKITYLNIGDNDFSEQDLSLFGELDFANLKLLYLHDNRFKGSLKPLEKMNNLVLVDISNTNIDSGLDSNFSYNLETFRFLSEREDNKGYLEIKNKLKEYSGGDDCYYDFSQ